MERELGGIAKDGLSFSFEFMFSLQTSSATMEIQRGWNRTETSLKINIKVLDFTFCINLYLTPDCLVYICVFAYSYR